MSIQFSIVLQIINRFLKTFQVLLEIKKKLRIQSITNYILYPLLRKNTEWKTLKNSYNCFINVLIIVATQKNVSDDLIPDEVPYNMYL